MNHGVYCTLQSFQTNWMKMRRLDENDNALLADNYVNSIPAVRSLTNNDRSHLLRPGRTMKMENNSGKRGCIREYRNSANEGPNRYSLHEIGLLLHLQ